ncbi:MAG: metallophosphoesterase [Actinomycetales bacterium]|nr:metallophosphoesterase [Actinomycetales bacterium]
MSRAIRGAVGGLGAVAALGVGALAYGMLIERTAFTVRRERLAILPAGSRPLRILHLSDLHMAPWQSAKQRFVASLALLEPDLVVDTGDDLGHRDGLVGIRRAYAPFRGVPGVFVHGSNDRFGPVWKNPVAYLARPSDHRVEAEHLDTEALDRFLADDLGWWSLENAARAVELRGHRIEFFGTADAHRGWDDLPRLATEIERMREAVEWSPRTDAPALAIGVTHAPYRRVLDALTAEGADLLIAGHTHGGQVRVPGFPALVANCDLPRRQAQGVSAWRTGRRRATLEVSAGLGTSIYAPVRFGCRPEAVVLDLVPAP